MSQSVKTVKHFASGSERDKGSSWAVGNVDDDGFGPDVDGLEVKTSSSFLLKAAEVWVESLLIRDRVPVQAKVSDGVDDAVRVSKGNLSFFGR